MKEINGVLNRSARKASRKTFEKLNFAYHYGISVIYEQCKARIRNQMMFGNWIISQRIVCISRQIHSRQIHSRVRRKRRRIDGTFRWRRGGIPSQPDFMRITGFLSMRPVLRDVFSSRVARTRRKSYPSLIGTVPRRDAATTVAPSGLPDPWMDDYDG